MVYGVNAMQRWKNVRTIQITIVFKSRIQIRWFVELMLRQRWKQVQTIQIPILFESRIQIRWFVELMQGNVGNKFKPFK